MINLDLMRQLRQKHHWSQEVMAEKLNMSKNGYAKIERGESVPDLNRLAQIAHILEVNILKLLDTRLLLNDHSVPDNEEAFQLQLTIQRLNILLEHKNDIIALKEEIIAHKNALIAQKDAYIAILEELVRIKSQKVNINFYLSLNHFSRQNYPEWYWKYQDLPAPTSIDEFFR